MSSDHFVSDDALASGGPAGDGGFDPSKRFYVRGEGMFFIGRLETMPDGYRGWVQEPIGRTEMRWDFSGVARHPSRNFDLINAPIPTVAPTPAEDMAGEDDAAFANDTPTVVLENLIIAIGMGWDLEGSVKRAQACLAREGARRADGWPIEAALSGFHIVEPSERHAGAILIADADYNDIAEFFHNEHATVGQSYEQALRLAHLAVLAGNGPLPGDDFTHRCSTHECPSYGERTSAGSCRCHRTREQMMAAEIERLRMPPKDTAMQRKTPTWPTPVLTAEQEAAIHASRTAKSEHYALMGEPVIRTMIEALRGIAEFAWSSMSPDCPEAGEEVMRRINACRAVLRAAQQSGEARS